ncbi:hypothetical protein ILYODFUR_016856 [Ilyodon furcidens]|uniref:Uncharacterized protein n=1 Tax=Ilyodon furcidens TaxID=33524 RepID=A0ABV0UI53_9TELE
MAGVVGIRPVTAGLLVPIPALSVSIVVSLVKTFHPHSLLMVVRGPSGADCDSLTSVRLSQGCCGYKVVYHCQCVNVCINGWMTDCVKNLGISWELIKCYTSAGLLPFNIIM